MIYQEMFEVNTEKGISLKDITNGVINAVRNSEITTGICSIFIKSTTAGLFINENERMLLEDLKKNMKTLADDSRIFHHPSNAASHIRANFFEKDVNIPVRDGELALGTWQSVFLAEFDVENRKRSIVITVSGE